MGILSNLFGKKEKQKKNISNSKVRMARKFYNNCPICKNKNIELVAQAYDETFGFREYKCRRCKCSFRTVERDDADYIASIRRMAFRKIQPRTYRRKKIKEGKRINIYGKVMGKIK